MTTNIRFFYNMKTNKSKTNPEFNILKSFYYTLYKDDDISIGILEQYLSYLLVISHWKQRDVIS